MINIILFIDAVASGGAQRQLVGLAKLLRGDGFNVKVVTYFESEFYKSYLEDNNVEYVNINGASSKFARIFYVYSYFKKNKPDVVISFLDTPNIISILLRLCGLKFKLIVSERNTTQQLNIRERCKFYLYNFADVVVCNSYTQTDFIHRRFLRLKNKTRTITNFVDLDVFRPIDGGDGKLSSEFKIVVVARFEPQKNAIAFFDAMIKLKSLGYNIKVDWYGNYFLRDGNYTQKSNYYLMVRKFLQFNHAEDFIILHNQTEEIEKVINDCTVFCLPSLYEGYSNVICEAISCGKVVLASKVSDNSFLVVDGMNGYLFDPMKVDSIVECFVKTFNNEDIFLSARKFNISYSHETFSEDLFLSKYIEILNGLKQ